MGFGVGGKGVISRHQFLILSNLVRASKKSISANYFESQKFTQEVPLKRPPEKKTTFLDLRF